MTRGVQMLIKHLSAPESKIFIQVDSDADGYTSSALLLNYLHEWVPSIVDSKITYGLHAGKEHGIELELVPSNVTLVIVPDASSDQADIHKQLTDKGIDVLVIDHHESDCPDDYACIINNQLCDYPNKALSGVGMVYKFCQKLDTLLNRASADNYLDLVALGLIADMMSMLDFETHHLTQLGLKSIRNPFIKGMIEKNAFSIGDTITPIGIAFYVAPFVNAMNRSGTIEEKTLLFESLLDWKALDEIPSTKRGCKGSMETRVEQAVRTATNVKSRQTKAQDNFVLQLEDKIVSDNLLDNKILLFLMEDVDKNLAGLVANKFMAKYNRPTAVLSKKYEDDGKFHWVGSARGCANCALTSFRDFCRDSELVDYAQGHAQAFGLSIPDAHINAFKGYAQNLLKDMDFTPSYKVDFIYSANDFKPNDILSIGEMKSLWGQDLSEALVAIEGIHITKDNLTLMSKDKNPTLKITLPNGVTCIKFKSNEEEYNQLFSDSGCVVINAIAKCELNNWNGRVTPQLIIENYTIMNKQQWFF